MPNALMQYMGYLIYFWSMEDMKAMLAHLRANRDSIIASWIAYFGKAELKR